MTKETAPSTQQPTVPPHQPDSPLAITSMILGIVSLTGFGFLLGIPAIVLAAIVLKRKLPGHGLSIAGLVTGIVSTAISLIFAIFFVIGIIWAINHPEDFNTPQDNNYSTPRQSSEPFNSSRT